MTAESYAIRLSVPGDLTALDALFARAYPKLLAPDYPPSVLVTALPIIARAQPALLASGTFRVAEWTDGRLVAAGGWTPRGAGLGDIRHVVTDDRFLRRGIARALLKDCLDEARAQGVRQMICQSTRTAVPFYEALGFEVERDILVPLRPGIEFPAIRMTQML